MNEEFLERITKDSAVNWAKETYGDPRYKDLSYLTDLKMAYSAGVQAERDGAITCYNEVLAELREEVEKLRHQSINWVPVFDANMELQTQNATLHEEVEKYKCLDGFKQLQEEARKQTAQEIIQYIIDQGVIQDRFDGELVYYIIDSDINELRQRYGLEG